MPRPDEGTKCLGGTGLPDCIASVSQLEDLLSAPTDAVIETMRRLEGGIVFLGVGGKMGPTLARMAKRASEAAGVKRRIIGVSRFSNKDEQARLQAQGIETLRANLLDEGEILSLPHAPNVVFMAGMKFGASGNEPLTWAMNSYLPAIICRYFQDSRIVAFSTGNVYGLTPVADSGSTEADAPAPVGEYAMSCLGRERMFEHFSRTLRIPTALIRLNYACELRYGVLVDIAQRVWTGQPVDLAMGHLNTIWQGDANAMTLQCFSHVASPPFVINLTGPELISVRVVAEEFAARFKKAVQFTGTESGEALLSNTAKAFELYDKPLVTVGRMMDWISDWMQRGGPSLGKPTHFESRDGRF
jgi:hypothetical protein